MKPKFFVSADKLREWYLKNHDKQQELVIGFYKVGSGKKSIAYQEAVDEALAFGWIDGIRNSIDDISYSNRFTPRKKNSIWSQINIKRVEMLKESGRMHEAGWKVFMDRNPKRTNLYSFEQKDLKLAPAYEKIFKANKKAWSYFLSKPPSYKKPCIHWIMSAKQEETRIRRLTKLIHLSGEETTLPQLTRKPK